MKRIAIIFCVLLMGVSVEAVNIKVKAKTGDQMSFVGNAGSLTNFPSEVVLTNSTGVALSGTFTGEHIGNAGGLTNIPPSAISGIVTNNGDNTYTAASTNDFQSGVIYVAVPTTDSNAVTKGYSDNVSNIDTGTIGENFLPAQAVTERGTNTYTAASTNDFTSSTILVPAPVVANDAVTKTYSDNAGNISTGTLGQNRLPTEAVTERGTNTYTAASTNNFTLGAVYVATPTVGTNPVTKTYSDNAGNISSGTLSQNRLPTQAVTERGTNTYTAASTNDFSLSQVYVATPTVGTNPVTKAYSDNADNISSGTLGAARLPSTAVTNNGDNVYTAASTNDFQLGVVYVASPTVNTNPATKKYVDDLRPLGYADISPPYFIDTNSVVFSNGNGYCSGTYFSFSNQTHDLTGIGSVQDFHYIYIDFSASTFPTALSLYDSTNEPVARTQQGGGFYNSTSTADRVVAALFSTNGVAALRRYFVHGQFMMFTPNSMSTGTTATNYIPIFSFFAPTGKWESPNNFDTDVVTPVNVDEIFLILTAEDASSANEIWLSTEEFITTSGVSTNGTFPRSGIAFTAPGIVGGRGFGTSVFTGQMRLGPSRKVLGIGPSNDDPEFTVLLRGLSCKFKGE